MEASEIALLAAVIVAAVAAWLSADIVGKLLAAAVGLVALGLLLATL